MLEPQVYGLVYDYVGAWNRHDADDLARLYAEDALYEELRMPATLRGSAAVRAHFRQLFAGRAGAVLALAAEPLATSDRAYVEWLMVGGDGAEAEEIRGVSVMLIEDGRIVRQTDYPHRGPAPRISAAAALAEDNVAWGE